MKMSLEEKLLIFKNKGWKYNYETGDVFSHTGKIIKGKNSSGYIQCVLGTGKNIISVSAHQLGWYLYKNEIPNVIDHINRNILDNRIDNLRNVNYQLNQFNRKSKGYRYHKRDNVYYAQITINKKNIHLGTFINDVDAREAYLNAKKIYHKI